MTSDDVESRVGNVVLVVDPVLEAVLRRLVVLDEIMLKIRKKQIMTN